VRRNLPFLIIATVLAIAVAAGLMLYRSRMEPEPPAATSTSGPRPTETAVATAPPTETVFATPNVAATPPASTTPVAPTAGPTFSYGRAGAEPPHFRGDATAPVVLEEFGDFQCPPCALLWPTLEKLEHDYEKRLVVVFREHPLKNHRYARDAAWAAEAAGLQGKFWEMHDALYRNRAVWTVADYVGPYLTQYATELGLDLEHFKTDMTGDEVAKRIATDLDRGDSLGVDRTPFVFVNGEKIPASDFNDKGLRAAIDKALDGRPQPESTR
jgi:protein-disulfide isomerase